MKTEEKLNKILQRYETARDGLKRTKKKYRRERQVLAGAQEALTIVQALGVKVQQSAHSQIAGVVSRCLETVFDDPYEFAIVFERKRSRTEARLTFIREGVERDPRTGVGGGVLDVAAFALRVAALVLTSPTPRKVLVLDEPFRFVSHAYRPRVSQMLEALAKDLKIQFIQVTHIEALKIGKIVSLESA